MSPHYPLRNSILVLALIFVGCQPDEKVTVSGAVTKPGVYRYAPGRPASDYLEDAGGATEEALLDEAYVSRVRADTSGVAEIGDVTIPLSENPEISPGDEIRIPGRIYDVRLDTVRLVHDVRMVDGNRIYRIPSGALVTGWTERGIQVALMLGRGKVFETPDTAKAVSAFHYLYIHLHPGEYPRLARFTGEVVDSLEALEDANVIHSRVVNSLEHLRDGGLLLPPDGYWRVMEGYFLVPRSASRPGGGMRRRRFEDGRVLTTFPDGRQRWQHPDGRVSLASPSGATEDRFPDGRIVFTDRWKNVRTTYPDGRVNVAFPSGATEDRFPDGRIVYTDRWKNVRTTYPDGRREWRMASGRRVERATDGRIVRHNVDGDLIEKMPDGGTRRVALDSSTWIKDANGVITLIGGKSLKKIYPDGRHVLITEKGDEITRYPDGRRVSRLADGSVVHSDPADSVAAKPASRQAAGIPVEKDPRETPREGVTSIRSGDGRLATRGEGSLRTVRPDEYVTSKGGTRETFPDGRRVESYRVGHTITSWPDGRKEVRMPVAYGYPGQLKTGLATVDRLPKAVAVGEELTVSGQIHGEVEDINVMAFLVPDGDAIKGDVRRRGRRFHARFRFGEAGHCRVQVQVVLPRARTYTVSHQSVIVGNPDDLEGEVLEIAPYPGDEAAQLFLIDRINAARKRIRRGSVFPHPELMHVARIRLEEMLAMGYISHFSMTGLDVGWHAAYRRLPFHDVGENVARTRFVETMHAGWMLSAGHRANILAKHWTHVGVAVAEAEGSVWGVQVFGRRFDRGP